MVEEEKNGIAIFSANDLERIYGSRKRLLLLSHAFHDKKDSTGKSLNRVS